MSTENIIELPSISSPPQKNRMQIDFKSELKPTSQRKITKTQKKEAPQSSVESLLLHMFRTSKESKFALPAPGTSKVPKPEECPTQQTSWASKKVGGFLKFFLSSAFFGEILFGVSKSGSSAFSKCLEIFWILFGVSDGQ